MVNEVIDVSEEILRPLMGLGILFGIEGHKDIGIDGEKCLTLNYPHTGTLDIFIEEIFGKVRQANYRSQYDLLNNLYHLHAGQMGLNSEKRKEQWDNISTGLIRSYPIRSEDIPYVQDFEGKDVNEKLLNSFEYIRNQNVFLQAYWVNYLTRWLNYNSLFGENGVAGKIPAESRASLDQPQKRSFLERVVELVA